MRARVLAEVAKIRAEHAARVARVSGPPLDDLARARIRRKAFAAVAARTAAFADQWAAVYPVPAAPAAPMAEAA